MGTSKRYAAQLDARYEQRVAAAAARPEPLTLPLQAYGPEPIEWHHDHPRPVWAWIIWRDGPATRIPAVADGWNDRVVIVGWEADGGRRTVVVWRNAVSVRASP